MASSRPLNHAFSFENYDETSLQSGGRRQQGHQQQPEPPQQQQRQQYEPYRYPEPYRDDPQPSQEDRQSPPYGGSPAPAHDYSVGQSSPPQLFHHHPGAHPASSYSRLQASRRISTGSASPTPDRHPYDNIDYTAPASPTFYPEDTDARRNYGLPTQGAEPVHRKPVGAAAIPYGSLPAVTGTSTSGPTPQPYPSNPQLPLPTDSSSSARSPPPLHQEPTLPRLLPASPATDGDGRYWGSEIGYSMPAQTTSTATPGMDNVGEASVGGGMTGLAMGVAADNQRESGVRALQVIENGGHAGPPGQEGSLSNMAPNNQRGLPHQASSSSLPRSAPAMPLGPGQSRLNTSDNGSLGSNRSQDRYMGADAGNHYTDPHMWDPRVSQTGLAGGINPEEVADDADDGLNYPSQDPRRRSMLSLGRQSTHSTPVGSAGAARGGPAAAGGMLGTLGGLVGRNNAGGNPEPSSSAYGLVSPSGEPASLEGNNEKSEWLNQQTSGNKKMKWIVGIIIALVVLAAVGGGIAGGILGSKKNSGSGSGGSSSGDPSNPGSASDNGPDLSKNSAEIKKLMNNPNLHRVFPGMDYTPLNAATYPDCLVVPPNQNNVTRDIAVMSQLTNTIRLYGSDCNQTEMILHSIKALGVDMKVWLGVWQDSNATTNARQLEHMYSLLDEYGADPFAGVIVGNEVLFRKDMTEPQLMLIIQQVKTNLTSKGYKLPIATADLGDNWDATLAGSVDVVMSNVHPFFAGVTADAASGWSWDFWQNHNVALTAGLTNKPKYIISEIGWPSDGGNDCGVGVTCTDSTSGSVAGAAEMSTFMNDFVCQSLTNGTTYFWFSAFDEPWKVKFNQGRDQWEDKWGLMDVNRNLKKGVKIPDCGGQSVP